MDLGRRWRAQRAQLWGFKSVGGLKHMFVAYLRRAGIHATDHSCMRWRRASRSSPMLSHANMLLSSKVSLRLAFWERARSGQGFESRQLHHRGLTRTLTRKGGGEEAAEAVCGDLLRTCEGLRCLGAVRGPGGVDEAGEGF
jgi:hypothetical protein